MKAVFFLIAALVAVNAATYEDVLMGEWNLYKSEFNKPNEGPIENLRRMDIFLENKKKVAEHNLKYAKGEVSYEMGLNELSDRFPEELARLNGFRPNEQVAASIPLYHKRINVTLPDYVNWVERGAVTPVKNQGSCGSCYAFSAMGSLESMHYIKYGTQVRLSEQNIVDCTGNYGNYGCNGGFTTACYEYVQDNRGVDTEQSYPYEGRQNYCRFNRNYVGATVSAQYRVKLSEEDLQWAVAEVGPIAIAVHVTNNFHNYRSGVFYDNYCRSDMNYLNHAVLVVGYGTENGVPYWLVKNSWGGNWGERGYIKMARNRNNNCGIATFAVFPEI